MTLTARLTAFFLATLGVALAAFSAGVYLLAAARLSRQVDDRVAAALDTLVAAAEVEPDGLEWDRRERTIRLPGGDAVTAWAVFDATGRDVDGPEDDVSWLAALRPAGGWTEAGTADVDRTGRLWRVAWRAAAHPSEAAVDRRTEPGELRVPGAERYRTLAFAAAVPLAPIHADLRALAWTLAGASAAAGVLAALGGRWACRRALAPVGRLAAAARDMTVADWDRPLPVPATRDELYTLGAAFNDLLARLRDAFERQQRFTAEASHQLRTPLTAILGQAEVALRRDRDGAEYRRVLAATVAQAGRLRDITEALLFLARADAEAEAPELARVDLAAWAADHLVSWQDHARWPDIRLDASGPAPAAVHPVMLGDAVDALLDNACKYSPPGTPVTVRVRRERTEAVIEVEDRGTGVSADERPHLFRPFFRARAARESGVGGTGLGLCIARRLVGAMRGQAEAADVTRAGSRFRLRFPIT